MGGPWRQTIYVGTQGGGHSNLGLEGSLLLRCAPRAWPVLSRVRLCVTPWTAARQAPLSSGCSRQEYWSGLPRPPPADLPHPGIEPRLLHLRPVPLCHNSTVYGASSRLPREAVGLCHGGRPLSTESVRAEEVLQSPDSHTASL